FGECIVCCLAKLRQTYPPDLIGLTRPKQGVRLLAHIPATWHPFANRDLPHPCRQSLPRTRSGIEQLWRDLFWTLPAITQLIVLLFPVASIPEPIDFRRRSKRCRPNTDPGGMSLCWNGNRRNRPAGPRPQR